MAPGSKAKDQDRPGANDRIHSGLENILPANFVDMQKCAGDFPKESKETKSRSQSRSRPAPTPYSSLSHSVSSLTDNFMLEHWGSSSKVPQTEHDGGKKLEPPSPPKEEDAPSIISNWAHLSYMKAQRNILRAELKAQQVAGTEAKKSVSSLRRLAFRMAVNISVKEKQVATTARNLAKSRSSNYAEGKNAQKRVEELKRALRVEEGRSKEILEALERASMLTLQCSTPEPESEQKPKGLFLSPPPSPPTRRLEVFESPAIAPKNSMRPSSSPWHDVDLELTPRLATPAEIRTSDSRLIQAKRESDQALAACRRRIEALQNECAQSQEEGKHLETIREGLEQEIRSHQSRIAVLERSRTEVEEAIESTKSQLGTALGSEQRLKQELEAKSKEIADWEQKTGDKQHVVEELQKEKDDLEQRLRTRNEEFRELEMRTVTLKETLQSLHSKLETAECHETSLQARLAEKESECEDLRKRLEQSSQSVGLLEKKTIGLESQAAEQLRKIQLGESVIHKLRELLQESQTANKTTDDALTVMKEEIALLQHKVSDYESDIEKHLKQIEVSASVVSELREQLQGLRTMNRTTEDTLTALKEEVARLQEKARGSESDIEEHLRKIEINGTVIEKLREQLRESQTANRTTEDSSAALKEGVCKLQADLQKETDSYNALVQELETMRVAKAGIEHKLKNSQTANKDKEDAATALKETMERLQTGLISAAHARDELFKELEAARAEKAGVEDELKTSQAASKDAEDTVAALKEEVTRLQTNLRTETDVRDGLLKQLGAMRSEKANVEIELQRSQIMNADIEKAVAALKEKVVLAHAQWRTETDARDGLIAELEATRTEKANIEEELRATRESLEQETSTKTKFQSGLESLRSSYKYVQANLRATNEHIQTLEADDTLSRAKLETLQDGKAMLEADLREARQVLFRLREDLRMRNSELGDLRSAKSKLEQQLQGSEERALSLGTELEQAQALKQEADDHHAADLQQRDEHLRELEASMLSLRSVLASSEKLESSLREELQRMQGSNDTVKGELSDALRSKADLQNQVDHVQSRLTFAERNRNTLQTKVSQLEGDLKTNSLSTAKLGERLVASADESSMLKNYVSELEFALKDSRDAKAKVDEALSIAQMDGEASGAEIANLHKQLHEAKAAQGEVQRRLDNAFYSRSDLEQQLQFAQGRITEINEVVLAAQTEGKSSEKEVARLSNQLEEAKAAKEETQKRLDDAVSSISGLEKQLQFAQDRLAGVEKVLSTAQRVNEASGKEIAGLRDQLDEARAAQEETQKRLHETAGPKADLEQQLQSAQTRLAELESETGNIRSQLSTLRNEAKELRKSKKQVSEQLTTLNVSHVELKQELRSIQSQLHAAQAQISQLEAKVASTEEELEVMHQVEVAAERRHKEALESNAELEKELDLARESKASTESQFHSIMSSNAQMKEDLNTTRSRISTADAKNANLASQLSYTKKELEGLQQLRDDVDEKLSDAVSSNKRLKEDLGITRSRLGKAEAGNDNLASRLSDAEGELKRLQQLKDDINKRLGEALTASASTEKSLSSTNSRLQELELQNSATTGKLSQTNEVLVALRQAKVELEQKLDSSAKHAVSLQGDVTSLRSHMEEVETSKVILVSQLSAGSKDLEKLQADHTELEEQFRTTSRHTSELENELRAAQMRLEIAESEGLDAINKLLSVEKELISLHEANAELEISETDLISRLASAEEDLVIVREKNASLEAFLEHLQSKLDNAEHTIEEREQRHQKLVDESQVKLDAVRTSELGYKRRLSERNDELDISINKNLDLQHHIDDQTRELGALEKGKGKLVEELSKKEKFIEELQLSTEERTTSMDSAYGDLRKKFEEQQQQYQLLDGDHKSAVRLESELERKITEIEEMQHNHREFEASFEALEKEVRALREDKKSFEHLVSELQEKIRHLQALGEWNRPSEPNRTSSPRHITIVDGAIDTTPSSPILSERSMSSVSHISGQHERPETRASTVSQDDPDSWGKRVDQVRMQRNEAANQLKGMKKSRHNLKKTLRDSDAQLHRLEKEGKPPKRPQNLLRKKSRPMTPNSTDRNHPTTEPKTPTRPTTSHLFSFTPRSATVNSRHSTYIAPPASDPRPKTSGTPVRPKTSHSLRKSDSLRNRLGGRPTTSAGDQGMPQSAPRESKRRWSSGLRNLFHRDG